MSDRLIFIGASGAGKSTAALGFMQKPSGTTIIQHKGSQGFKYLVGIPALKELTIVNASDFAEFAKAAEVAIAAKKDLIIVDDYDYLFRDAQRGARMGKTGNAQRLASQPVYQEAEQVVKRLTECGATVIFTCKAVAKAISANETEVGAFLPGLHAHMETGIADAVLHFVRRGPNFVCRSKGWVEGNTVYYAKATIGLGDFLPQEIELTKIAGKPYSTSVRDAMAAAKKQLAAAFGSPEPTPTPEQKKEEPAAPGTGPLFSGGTGGKP